MKTIIQTVTVYYHPKHKYIICLEVLQIMGNDFVVTLKEEKTVTIAIRIDKKIQEPA